MWVDVDCSDAVGDESVTGVGSKVKLWVDVDCSDVVGDESVTDVASKVKLCAISFTVVTP